MLTNHSDAVYKKLCIELGVNIYLDKANDFTLLPGLVEKEMLKDQQTISEL
jgi:hypothetical protein